MSGEFVDSAYKTGAGRYLQERGAINLIGQEVGLLGSKAYVMGGPTSLLLVRKKMEASLAGASIPFVMREYARPAVRSVAREMGEEALREGCDVVVGVGGGRMMDAAKAVACSAGLPLIEVPTSVATCAAYSPLSVMYTLEGAHDGTWRFTHEIDAVIVDVDVMEAQPPRLIAAGVLDAMAKVLEIENGGIGVDCATDSVQRFAAYEYAKVNYGLLVRYGKQAFDEAEARRESESIGAAGTADAVRGAGMPGEVAAPGGACAVGGAVAPGEVAVPSESAVPSEACAVGGAVVPGGPGVIGGTAAPGGPDAGGEAVASGEMAVPSESTAPGEAIERIAFTNIALTGIVSSLTRGFHQTAHAHKLYDGVRTVFGQDCAGWLHGELVAIGLIMQLVYNGQAERIPELRTFMRSMGMPCSLSDVGIRDDDPRFGALYDYVALSEFVEEGEDGAARIAAAFDAILE